MAKHQLQPDEKVLWEGGYYGLQGGKVKFPVSTKNVITNRRLIHYHLGKMAPFYNGLGILLRLLVNGKPMSMQLDGMKVSRGKYVKNKKLLSLKSVDGAEVLLSNFDKTLNWLRNILETNGISLTPTGEEEWRIKA